jgi:putative hydrolase of the HAD superfamily
MRDVRSTFCEPIHWHTFEDTLPTLATLRAHGWTHVILSNHVPELATLVDHLGLQPLVAAVFSSAIIGAEKPHPAAFQVVLGAIGPVDAVWMVGDNTQADIAGAEAAGIPGILVRQHHPEVPHCCADLQQLVSHLMR